MRKFLFLVLVFSITPGLIAGWWPFKKKETYDSGEKKSIWSKITGKGSSSGSGKKSWNPLKSGSDSDTSDYLAEVSYEERHILYRDSQRDYLKMMPSKWNLKVRSDLAGLVWLGTTYKEVPLTRIEYEEKRNRLLKLELSRRKREFIKKKKAEATGEAPAEEEVLDDSAIDSFIDGDLDGFDVPDPDAPEAPSSGGSLTEEDEKFLEGFDEEEVIKQILMRLIVPRSSSVQTDAAYFQTKDKDLYCVELETGITVWVIALNAMIEKKPYETKHFLHYVSDGYLNVIDKQAGLMKYRSLIDRAVQPVTFATSESYFVASYRRRVLNWQPEKRFAVWATLLPGEITGGVYGNEDNLLLPQESGELAAVGFDGKKKWTFINKGISEDKLYLERELRNRLDLIAREQSDAKRDEREVDRNKVRKLEDQADEFQHRIDQLSQRQKGKFLSAPVTHDESIYIANTDFNLYKINRYSGIPQWQYTCKDRVMESPFVGKRFIWQRDNSNYLHCIDTKSGYLKERYSQVKEVLYGLDDLAYFRTIDGKLKVRSRYGISDIEGLDGQSIIISEAKKILFSYNPKQSVITAFDLTSVRR